MVNVRDLRIGNYLHKDGHCLYIEVEHIEHIRDGNRHNFKPIPLTHQLLLQLNFQQEYGDTRTIYRYKGFGLLPSKDHKGKWVVLGASAVVWQTCLIEYLHQLQNVIWCLTGEELPVNMGQMV